MRKNVFLNLILLVSLALVFTACSNKKSEKKEDKKQKVKKETTKKTKAVKIEKNSEIIDLSNKGIGPIKKLKFDDIDDDLANEGGLLFKQKCMTCHKTNKKSIGPKMKGIYEKRSPEWVMNMMLNPIEMLDKDPIAKQQLIEYKNVMMIDQNLSEVEARALAEYFRTL